MIRILTLVVTIIAVITAHGETFSYRFNSTPLPKAIQRIIEDNPDLDVNFIYNELEHYHTNATVYADNAYDALRQTIGLNPVSVTKVQNSYYLEALQQGKYLYSGKVIGTDSEPVVAATVMLLTPKDSTVLTYGITDDNGHFSIPCDRQSVLAKLSCVGYKITYKKFDTFNVGTVVLPEQPIQLKGVTVEGNNATLLADKSIYRPTQRQKNASQNAIDLLRQMAIPQIQINPISNEVTDNAGIKVAIFINYLPASNEELEGMRTLDVKKIEYLEFPIDPRFRGAQRVVNIIVQEYEYGGYSKITASENFLIGLSSRANVFSKFTYKKMTYDLYAGVNNWNSHHIGNFLEGNYSLKDGKGEDYSLTRIETLDRSHFKQNQVPVTFRATYASEKIQIRNTLGFTYLDIPTNKEEGSLRYEPSKGTDYTYVRSNPSRTNSLAYQGTYYFSLPKQFAVDISPRFNYSHSIDNLLYDASNSSAINRNARENAYNYRVDAYLEKNFAQKHTAILGVNGGDKINLLNYSGTNNYHDRFHNAFIAGLLGYQLQGSKIRLYADAGVYWSKSDINGIIYNDAYPFVHLNLSYSPNYKNSLSAFLQYANATPGINQKSPDILKDNEYMYVTGNPLLENSRNLMVNLSYTWIPSNSFGLSAFSNLNEFFDRQLIVYEPYNDGEALIRSYINSGNYIKGEIGLGANWKLFDGKLQLYAAPKQVFYKSTGIYSRKYNPCFITLQATYYLNNFYCQLYYKSPDKQMFTASPQIYKESNYHSVIVGWANSNWNVRLAGINLFNHGWVSSRTSTETPLYSEYKETIGTTAHPYLNLSLTYTFGYGKKVQRGNEVGAQSGASSAILK